MTLNDFKKEIISWKISKQKAIYFVIGIAALLVYGTTLLPPLYLREQYS